MIVCYHCGKQIKGKMVKHVPSNLHIQLGIDFIKSFHPSCYKKAGKEVGLEISR